MPDHKTGYSIVYVGYLQSGRIPMPNKEKWPLTGLAAGQRAKNGSNHTQKQVKMINLETLGNLLVKIRVNTKMDIMQ